MSCSNDIKKKIYNVDLVVEDIKLFPQTYKTILQELDSDGTCQLILRRKLNILCKDGIIFKTSIPGTRFGKAIFYIEPKTYTIVIEGTRVGSTVYYFFDYKQIGRFYLKISPYWELQNNVWVKGDEKVIFEGNILKLI